MNEQEMIRVQNQFGNLSSRDRGRQQSDIVRIIMYYSRKGSDHLQKQTIKITCAFGDEDIAEIILRSFRLYLSLALSGGGAV